LTISLGIFQRPKAGVHIINAHYLNPHSDEDKGESFIMQLEHIKKYGQLIRIEEATELVTQRKKVRQPLVAFSFDDGFLDCYTVIAPILESFNTNAAFFINPNLIECEKSYYDEFSKRATVNNKKIMNWKQVKELKQRGHIIGAHTMDHVNLGQVLSLDELEYQLGTCKKVIEDKIENNCNMFAFPYGNMNHLSLEALELAKIHYKFIFSGTDYKNYYSRSEERRVGKE